MSSSHQSRHSGHSQANTSPRSNKVEADRAEAFEHLTSRPPSVHCRHNHIPSHHSHRSRASSHHSRQPSEVFPYESVSQVCSHRNRHHSGSHHGSKRSHSRRSAHQICIHDIDFDDLDQDHNSDEFSWPPSHPKSKAPTRHRRHDATTTWHHEQREHIRAFLRATGRPVPPCNSDADNNSTTSTALSSNDSPIPLHHHHRQDNHSPILQPSPTSHFADHPPASLPNASPCADSHASSRSLCTVLDYHGTTLHRHRDGIMSWKRPKSKAGRPCTGSAPGDNRAADWAGELVVPGWLKHVTT